MIIVNPFLTLSEFRFSGMSRYRHNGQIVQLGVGRSQTAVGWLSPVEANFSETSEGRSTRGSNTVERFYVAKQNLINEKLWHWTESGGRPGSWSLENSTGQRPDDPDPSFITFNSSPAEVSFYDSPGFMVFQFMTISPDVTRVCALQNFSLWIAVNPSLSRGHFQASSNVLWHHLLCLEKSGSRWQVVTSQSLLGNGELRLTNPLWN
jgi:hypothetical protein